jgi:hypothetical protein
MKFLFTLIFTIVGFISFSQPTYLKSYQTEVAHWVNNAWKYEDIKPCSIIFKSVNNMITVGDENHSSYYTYKQFYKEDKITKWQAIDENQTECVIALFILDDHIDLAVIYNDVSIIYYCHFL